MSKFISILIFTIVFMQLNEVLTINFCDPNLCPAGKKHIACNNPNFAAICPKNAHLVNMTTFRKFLVNEHNRYRNIVAGGGISKLEPAQRMGKMRWNQQLSNIASYNVKQCKMQHDQCRNSPTFPKAGQNLAYTSVTSSTDTPPKINYVASFKKFIQAFYIEYKNVNMNIINAYKAETGLPYGHFTGMMGDRNVYVGCAAAQYKSGSKNTLLMACNYALTNIYGKPVYVAGPTASGCKTGRDTKYTNLCSINEQYDTNF